MPHDFVTQILCICNGCSRILEDPRILPCQHSICINCIKEVSKEQHQNGIDITCPVCNSSHNIVIDSLPKNTILVSLRAGTTGFDGNTPETSNCKECSSTAVSWCNSCHSFFCSTCWAKFHSVSERKHHLSYVAAERQENQICEKHDDKLELFCSQDNEAICSQCLLENHSSHAIDTIQKIKNNVKENQLGKTNKIRKMLTTRIEKDEESMKKLEEDKRNLEEKIDIIRGSLSAAKERLIVLDEIDSSISTVIDSIHGHEIKEYNKITSKISDLIEPEISKLEREANQWEHHLSQELDTLNNRMD